MTLTLSRGVGGDKRCSAILRAASRTAGFSRCRQAERPLTGNDNVITKRYPEFRCDLMSIPQRRASVRETLNIRIRPEVRGLIDRAAALTGKNRTDFVLDAARQAAEDALLDRTVFTVSPKAYAEFLARLDAPPGPNERLRRTMRTAAPWD